ncbi:MAG: TraR/DksA C4-type zinc finger protein [Zoogloeaceae bacterium]|jgi:phage/conjugal plasmid C-4 type zinc finger TraR family protein|nr:TraR/DksA C4-type zinc finger protein [Zoogloeaceae bacterium]
MTDISDRATEREETLRADALAAHFRRVGTEAVSAKRCAVCDEPIPDARRRALPGVMTCVDCQSDIERALKQG